MKLRFLSAAHLEEVLPVGAAIGAVREAFVAVHRGDVVMPTRLSVATREGTTLVMPAHGPDAAATSVKVVSVHPRNADRELPVITGLVTLFDGPTGVPRAVVEGTALTALRTGAASGVATDALARDDARALAMIGAGAQARQQILAVCAVRPIESVYIYNRTPSRAERLASVLREDLPGRHIDVSEAVSAALRDADVICTATSATEPVLAADDVAAGSHVNAVGSFRPGMRELPRGLLHRAGRVFIDETEAALTEAGEVIDAIERAVLTHSDLVEVGAVLAGDAEGRRSRDDVTVFKSSGIAAQDLYAAHLAVANAEERGLGLLIVR